MRLASSNNRCTRVSILFDCHRVTAMHDTAHLEVAAVYARNVKSWRATFARHDLTLPRNYCMQPCYATYAMSNYDVQRLHATLLRNLRNV